LIRPSLTSTCARRRRPGCRHRCHSRRD